MNAATTAAAPTAPPVTTLVRLACLTLALSGYVLALGPAISIARSLGWRFAPWAPVLFQRLLCAGLGVKVRKHGDLCEGSRRLIVANHVSWLDVPVLASLAPLVFLAKKEVGSHAVGRWLVAMQGAVYVDRGRRSAIPAVNARMTEAMRSGSSVVLFAEATTGDGNRLLPFRSSHFEAIRMAAFGDSAVPAVVQPVYLAYSRLAGLPVGRGERPRIAWYGDMTFLPHFFRYARGGGVTCDVYCGPAIRVLPDTDRKTAARLTETAVRKLAAEARAGW